MGRRPLKKTSRRPRCPCSSPSPERRSTTSPEPERREPHPSTPRRTFPLNSILRALSTPLRPPSHHPFLRAFSTPALRRSEYSPQVRRLCQHGAYQRLPFDNDVYVHNELACSRCGKTGTITQNLVFKQGHAGEWVRACNNPDCQLIYYPPQPGTPPDLLLRIEAARATAASSSTMVTPESKSSRSSALTPDTNTPGQDVGSPIGGELEDWLSPLLREIDMEPSAPQHTSITSDSGSPEFVVGPSTGLGSSSLCNPPLQCMRDEEIARMFQAAVDEEDAQALQQFDESPPEPPLNARDREHMISTLSSLTAELAAITRTQAPQAEASPPGVRPPVQNTGTPSRCSSPESSPLPRPRKKKRILIHPTPPPPVRRRIRGPLPQAPSVELPTKVDTSARRTMLAQSGTVPNTKPRKPTKRCAKSKADPTPERRPPRYIIISSGDESVHDAGLRTARASQTSSTRPAADDDQDSIISIHSSDSEGDSAPPATQPRIPLPHTTIRSRTPSRNFLATKRTAHGDSEHESARPATQPRILRPRPTVRSRVPSLDFPATTRPAHDNDDDSESAPPLTQPRVLRSRPTVRSHAPSRDIATRPAHDDDDRQSTPSETQPRTTPSHSLDVHPQPAAATANFSEGEDQDPDPSGSSNKENDAQSIIINCLDESISLRLAARQALNLPRRHTAVFAPLDKSSSPSSSSSSSSESDDDAQRDPEPADLHAEPQSSSGNAGKRVDANEVFGDPFRFELYPSVPELAKITNPDVAKRHWVLTIKIWYMNNAPPSTKMIPLEDASCCIRLSDFFIVARAFQFTGVATYRLWNRFSTDWDSHLLYEYLSVSITDNHTLLVRLPTVATLSSWAENISQAYGPCQTVDPRPVRSRKGKERQHD